MGGLSTRFTPTQELEAPEHTCGLTVCCKENKHHREAWVVPGRGCQKGLPRGFGGWFKEVGLCSGRAIVREQVL